MNLRLTQQPEDKALTPENTANLRARLERVLGRPVEQIERTRGGGYTPALRLRVTLRGNPGTSVFIKHALQTLPRPS